MHQFIDLYGSSFWCFRCPLDYHLNHKYDVLQQISKFNLHHYYGPLDVNADVLGFSHQYKTLVVPRHLILDFCSMITVPCGWLTCVCAGHEYIPVLASETLINIVNSHSPDSKTFLFHTYLNQYAFKIWMSCHDWQYHVRLTPWGKYKLNARLTV